MKILYIYLLSVFCVVATSGQSFTTQVSARAIGKKDLIEVKYVAENLELSEFVLPKFSGWFIQSGPNFSSNMVQSGSSIKQQISYSFILLPSRSGRLSVPAATITIDKHLSRQSNTVTIDVKDLDHVAGSTIPSLQQPSDIFDDPPGPEDDFSREQVLGKGENPLDKIRSNLLVKLDVNKTTCFVGEPILATYKLCTRLKSESRVVKQPAFNGCTVTELTTENPTAKHETINGKTYNVYVVRKVLLYPLDAGSLVLPEANVENKVAFYKGESINYRDLYYNPSTKDVQQTQVTVGNKPITITVKPLPENAPSTFTGAVGKFRMAVLTETDKPITTNNTAGLLLVIEGEGNLQQMKPPVVTWPGGVEGFEPKDKDVADRATNAFRIQKTFTYPFVATKEGKNTIPPIQFTYFNPVEAKYVTMTSQPLSFVVRKGSTKAFSVFNSSDDYIDFQTRLYIILAAALLLAGIGLIIYNRRQKLKVAGTASKVQAMATTDVTPAKIVATPVEVNTPSDSEQYIHSIRDLNPIEEKSFYKHLQRHINGFLKARFNAEEEAIDAIALQHPAEAETFVRLKALLNDCRLGMYTPMFNTEQEMQHRMLATELLMRLEKR